MAVDLRHSCLGLLLGMLGMVSARSEPALGKPVDSFIQEFFDAHCVKCHGIEKQKGKVRLDAKGLADQTAPRQDLFSRILDMLETGEMPPEKEPRPELGKLASVIERLHAELAVLAGPRPLALRRLNRVEYEHTVQDLLGIDTPLAELLPEDGKVQGFDNVAQGLSVSAVLMERYLEAADTALASVIRRVKPLPPATRRSVMMERKENIESVDKKKGGTIEVEGAFVKFTPGWPPVRMDDAHPIEDGIYRCRLAVWPHDPGDRTMCVAIYVGPLFGPGKQRFMGMFDVTGTPDEPRIIEFTTRLQENDTMHVVPWVYPEHVTWRDKHEARPGIGVVWAETHGPLDQSWPAEAQRRLFGQGTSLSMKEGQPIWMRHRKGVKLHTVESERPVEDITRIVGDFVPRAFRRPVDTPLTESFVALALRRWEDGATFEQAVRAGLTAVLCSPHFLLLNQDQAVDDYTLASRLSYFLWSTMPDEELMGLAAQSRLRDPAVLHAQVDRMIDDERIERFVENFTGQWLDLRDIEFTTPDAKLYPEFDALLQESMLRESHRFFAHVLQENLSVMNFVDSEFTFLNERLARHYGIEGVQGHEKVRLVKLAPNHLRGGILTQGSVLKVTANGTTTSPVLRGAWVLDHLLGRPAPPPPAGVPAVEPDIRGATTIRQQLAKHRADESCARCHRRIDPPGFALECFDPIGGWRDRYRSLGEGEKVDKRRYRLGLAVENGGQTPDGVAFADFMEFRQWLTAQRTDVARALATKLLIYGCGRPVGSRDRADIEAVVAAAQSQNLGLRAMIHAVVDSTLFKSP